MIRRIVSLVLVLCILFVLPLSARAADKAEIEPYAQRLIQYYLHYQEDADDVVWDIVQQMKALDPQQAETWEKIMRDWSWVNSEMPVYQNVLPDGLPEDDSLCIVVMGYGLDDDGSMKEELVDRLVIALTSALKYPNAWVLVTGGQTSPVKGVTEAGQMAAWLKAKGLEPNRLIQETQSLSTTSNGVNVYKLLTNTYPQVDSIAVVTSDYHLAWSCAMFTAVSNYRSGYEGTKLLELVGNAVCETGETMDTLATQAWGVSTITGIGFDDNASAPELYPVDRPTEPLVAETEPPVSEAERTWIWEPEPQEAENGQEERKSVVPLVGLLLLAAAVYVLTPKRPKKRNRRQRPKMDWSDME